MNNSMLVSFLGAGAAVVCANAEISLVGTPLTLTVSGSGGSAIFTVGAGDLSDYLVYPYYGQAGPNRAFTLSSPVELRDAGNNLLGRLTQLHVDFGSWAQGDFHPAGPGPEYGRTAIVDMVFEAAVDASVTLAMARTDTHDIGPAHRPMGWGPYDPLHFMGWPPYWWNGRGQEVATIAVTDLNGDGVTGTGLLDAGMMLAEDLAVLGGTRERTHFGTPLTAGAGQTATSSVDVILDATDLLQHGPADPISPSHVIYSFGARAGVGITGGDRLEFHSRTTAIPEAGPLSLLGVGILTVARRRR